MGDLINPGKTAPGVPNLGTPQPDSPEITNAHRYCAGQRTPTRLKFLPAKPRPKSRKTQPLAELLKRVRTCGGYATIYSLRNDGVTRVIACIKQESALPTNPTDLPHAVAASLLREFHLKPRRESRASTSCTHRSNRSCFQNRNLVSLLKAALAARYRHSSRKKSRADTTRIPSKSVTTWGFRVIISLGYDSRKARNGASSRS